MMVEQSTWFHDIGWRRQKSNYTRVSHVNLDIMMSTSDVSGVDGIKCQRNSQMSFARLFYDYIPEVGKRVLFLGKIKSTLGEWIHRQFRHHCRQYRRLHLGLVSDGAWCTGEQRVHHKTCVTKCDLQVHVQQIM